MSTMLDYLEWEREEHDRRERFATALARMSCTDRFDRVVLPQVGLGLAAWLPEEPIVYGTNRDRRGYHAHAFSHVWAKYRQTDTEDDA